ncbi:FtsX-like permease family protein [Mucilaginibacter robiniae]|uniref:FtsX-like permease family protein n=1 Tax=Mucilaginibacter robiniae TaxID=2728022 RepID=A0A7L5E3X7_9SPHI|nr:ABC transporter permease [Mucilaginibacter robiniae]QJD97107.1 FtsX-like permease family protein [Mucilaginibacter robiniae]
MLKNYFIIAWRSLLKNKVYSLINICGLALGMALSMLIGLWIYDEVAYNTYHENYSTIMQVMNTQTFNGHVGTNEAIALPLAKDIKTKFSQDFKRLALATWNEPYILGAGEKKMSGKGMWVQPDFPEMLTLNMIKGSRGVLTDPSSAIISQSLAKALFGDADPMSQTVRVNNMADVKVAGVYKDLPYNTSFNDIQILLPWGKYITFNWVKNSIDNWGNHSWQLFAQVDKHADIEKINAKIRDLEKPHFKEGDAKMQLHPMSRWHLYSDFVNGKSTGGRIKFVWLFGIIGVFVLLLACINFMNLSTARSEKRAKEVGIRKAIGSMRQQLIGQFLSESVVMALLAFALCVILVLLCLPFFNYLSDKQIQLPWKNPVFWLVSLLFTIITGLVSGSYPAFYLSAFNPVKVLKGTFKAGPYAALPRKVLVVVQFTVSITLIIGTVIVFRQIQHAKNRPVGYNREGLITVDINTPDLRGHYDAIRSDLLKTGSIENMAESSSPSTSVKSNQIGFEWEGMEPGSHPLLGTIGATHDFGHTINWQVKQGRDFSRNFLTDSSAAIINEASAKIMGFKNPIGKIVKYNGKPLTIVGVIKNMVMESPYIPVQPTIFMISYDWANVITIKLKPGMPVREALAKIEPVFKKFDPSSPFDYKFVDQDYATKFANEERIGNLATFFAILAIFISSLGLFGLASFVAEQRTKEIGVRKILGASVYNLWQMLCEDFIILVIISCVIAIPIAWYFLSNWLQAYEYRTQISWWIFAVAGLLALGITLLTVSYQAIRAAIANPVRSLRTE